jgi:hypothetical protein
VKIRRSGINSPRNANVALKIVNNAKIKHVEMDASTVTRNLVHADNKLKIQRKMSKKIKSNVHRQ